MPLTWEKKEGVHFSQWIEIISEGACLKKRLKLYSKPQKSNLKCQLFSL